jgi:hypothetical protein
MAVTKEKKEESKTKNNKSTFTNTGINERKERL